MEKGDEGKKKIKRNGGKRENQMGITRRWERERNTGRRCVNQKSYVKGFAQNNALFHHAVDFGFRRYQGILVLPVLA